MEREARLSLGKEVEEGIRHASTSTKQRLHAVCVLDCCCLLRLLEVVHTSFMVSVRVKQLYIHRIAFTVDDGGIQACLDLPDKAIFRNTWPKIN